MALTAVAFNDVTKHIFLVIISIIMTLFQRLQSYDIFKVMTFFHLLFLVQYSTTGWPSSKHEAIMLSTLNGTFSFEQLKLKSQAFIAQNKESI